MIPIQEIRDVLSESGPTLEDVDTYVVSLCSGAFVRVPPWFSVGGALEVARFKNAHFALIEDKGTIVGVLDEAMLTSAPPNQILRRYADTNVVRVAPEISWREALSTLRARDAKWLLVSTENFLVGIITRESLERFERNA